MTRCQSAPLGRARKSPAKAGLFPLIVHDVAGGRLGLLEQADDRLGLVDVAGGRLGLVVNHSRRKEDTTRRRFPRDACPKLGQ